MLQPCQLQLTKWVDHWPIKEFDPHSPVICDFCWRKLGLLLLCPAKKAFHTVRLSVQQSLVSIPLTHQCSTVTVSRIIEDSVLLLSLIMRADITQATEDILLWNIMNNISICWHNMPHITHTFYLFAVKTSDTWQSLVYQDTRETQQFVTDDYCTIDRQHFCFSMSPWLSTEGMWSHWSVNETLLQPHMFY